MYMLGYSLKCTKINTGANLICLFMPICRTAYILILFKIFVVHKFVISIIRIYENRAN